VHRRAVFAVAGLPFGLRAGILWGLALTALFLGRPAPARAQDEFLLNDDRVDRNQWSPRAATGATGAIVVTWMDGRNQSGSTVDFDAYALTIRNPLAIGSTVNRRLNDDAPGAVQSWPDIDASATGTFFTVWEDSRAAGRDIYGATLDSLGLRITPNLRINDDTAFAEQANPQVVAVGADRYLVVWGDERLGHGEIFGSWRTASGAPIGSNFKISVDPVVGGSYQGEPALGSTSDGRVLVAWLDGREGGSVFGATFDVYGQFFDASGAAVGGNIKINDTTTPQRNTAIDVAADAALGYVVGWIDRRGFPTDPGDVFAQRYDASRAPLGGNIRVNDDPPGRDQRSLRACATPAGAYLIWEDLRGSLGIDSNVLAARVGYDALPAGANFRVNVSLPARQGTPGAVWDGRDAIFAAWEDGRNGPPDIYAISIFPDGTRRGTETQLNDDAAPMDQRRPRVGRGPGRYIATWLDFRNSRTDLFGQWITSSGGRDGTNHIVWPENAFERAVDASSAVSPSGAGLVVAQLTREADAGEIRGFLYTTSGTSPATSFWISDGLPSAQSAPAAIGTASEFAVVWIDTRDGTPRLYGQRLASNGARIGGNHPVLATDLYGGAAAFDLDVDPAGGYWLTAAEGLGAAPRIWVVHLGSDLAADRPAWEVAPGQVGDRAQPRIGVGSDGRVEVAWLGTQPSGLGLTYHQAFDSTGIALTSPSPLGLLSSIVDAAPSISVSGSLSVVTWEARDDGDWSVWMQAFEQGGIPVTGVLRVDQDVLGADQLDPTVGLDATGHATVLWADSRSASSGIDIVGRAFSFISTAVSEPPEPSPAPVPDPVPPAGRFRTGPARPNPFAGAVGMPIESADGVAWVSVRVVNVRGQVVATLHDGPLPPGARMLRWDGRDSRSKDAGSGIYWIVTEGGGERHATRVVQLR
jgi:hypothetical protein